MSPCEVDYDMISQIYENTKDNSKMLSSIMSSLNELTEEKKVVEDKEEQKKKMEEIFEKGVWVSPVETLRKSKNNILKW